MAEKSEHGEEVVNPYESPESEVQEKQARRKKTQWRIVPTALLAIFSAIMLLGHFFMLVRAGVFLFGTPPHDFNVIEKKEDDRPLSYRSQRHLWRYCRNACRPRLLEGALDSFVYSSGHIYRYHRNRWSCYRRY